MRGPAASRADNSASVPHLRTREAGNIKVDGCVPQIQAVNLRIVHQLRRVSRPAAKLLTLNPQPSTFIRRVCGPVAGGADDLASVQGYFNNK